MAGLAQATPPSGWHFCDGSTLPIAQNEALFAILGTTYGGDGVTTFGLPDFRGRVCVGSGQAASGTQYPVGQKTGSEGVVLQTSNMPAHNHTLYAAGTPATTPTLGASVMFGNVATGSEMYVNGSAPPAVTADASPAATTIQTTGGNQAHANVMPGKVLYYIIAMTGIFPVNN